MTILNIKEGQQIFYIERTQIVNGFIEKFIGNSNNEWVVKLEGTETEKKVNVTYGKDHVYFKREKAEKVLLEIIEIDKLEKDKIKRETLERKRLEKEKLEKEKLEREKLQTEYIGKKCFVVDENNNYEVSEGIVESLFSLNNHEWIVLTERGNRINALLEINLSFSLLEAHKQIASLRTKPALKRIQESKTSESFDDRFNEDWREWDIHY